MKYTRHKLKNALYIGGLGMLLMASASSCSLDEYNPVNLSEEETLNTFDGWKAYQSNCYTGLWGSLIGTAYGIVSEVGTDLWTFPYNNHHQYKDVMAYEQFTVNSGLVNSTWNYAWGSIKDCNKTIQMGEALQDGDPENIKVLVAEARLLRAYYYSVLVENFGDLPLVLVDDPVKNLSPTRNSVAEVYEQIIADLKVAAEDLPVTPYDGNLGRVTKKTALGLLTRAYAQGGGEGLQEGDKSYWERAKEVADQLINQQGQYNAMLYDDFSEVFADANNQDNKESIFTAYGLDAYNASYDYFTGNSKPNLYLHYYPKLDDTISPRVRVTRGLSRRTLRNVGCLVAGMASLGTAATPRFASTSPSSVMTWLTSNTPAVRLPLFASALSMSRRLPLSLATVMNRSFARSAQDRLPRCASG